jgi:ADA HAT complex component 1
MSNIATYLPSPETPRDAAPAVSRLFKRKRASDGEGEPLRETSALDMSDIHRAAPESTVAAITSARATCKPASHSVNITQRPSEGLPTPLLSPTSASMDKSELVATVQINDSVAAVDSSRTRTSQIVAQQVNLEILLKHNELRLIDQEIAKCQVALEQLRRCSEIPFPAFTISDAVSTGKGPALRQKYQGARLPTSPAPWGVVDGPYSRHYANWLLPDAHFDGGEPDATPQGMANGKRPAKGRHGRPSIVEDMQIGMSSRSQRNGSLQSLPSGYAPPKEKTSGPLLLKRSSDGKMVKLKCPDCGRHNFGSAQGFINHCRIGHGRTFPSHDAAAEHCGELVEYDSTGAVLGVEPVSQPSTTNVHPLVRSAHLLPVEPAPTPRMNLSKLDTTSHPSQQPREQDGGDVTPFLSALIQSKGLGVDLQNAVSDAKIKSEAQDSDVDMSDDEEDVKAAPGQTRVPGTRQIGGPSKKLASSQHLIARMPASHGSAGDFSHHIEPSPTAESNQAPSLIDDDEDFEAGSPASTPPSEAADEDMHIRVRDDDDAHQEELHGFQPNCARDEQPVSSPIHRASALRRDSIEPENKHVSFETISSLSEQTSPDRSKRRKITK